MSFIRNLLLLIVLAVFCVMAYNYWSGHGWTLRPASSASGIDVESARRRGAEIAGQAAERAENAAVTIEQTVTEAALTAKIKSKMALDDHVKSRSIDVDTSGSTVTLTGVVESAAEREQALRLARDTEGVTNVIDNLEVRK
jgi:hyperosmotically inducible protein